MKSWYKQSQTCFWVHGHVSLRNIMFGYGWNSHTHKNEGQITVNYPDVSITCTCGVWKLDGIQWKVDAYHPKIAWESIGMYHWEI